MAKRKYIDYKKQQQELFKRTEGYAADVRKIYQECFTEIINLVKGTVLEDGKPFSFTDYGYSEEVTPILRAMYSRVYQVIRGGVQKEWLKANENNDNLVKAVFGESSIGDNHFARFFQRNMEAMDAFFQRKKADGGLNLSQNVWNYTGQFREELENTLDLAIGEGIPANQIAARVKKYLNDPDRYYRRFRVKVGEDEAGNPIYGRIWKRRIWDSESGSYKWIDANPKHYHPGKGVYRSSARNAQRLVRTETNIAYRSADYERWGQLDFVIGIEIKLSNNHPCTDICDDLKGIYPKDFKWTGWHPNCRCYQVPVLCSETDMDKMLDTILDGGEPSAVEVEGKVTDMPRRFTDWVKDNAGRIEKATRRETLPYFIKDNKTVVDGIIRIENNRKEYESYDDDWKRVCFYEKTGGYVVAHVSRVAKAGLNKQELAKYEKELGMARVFASEGNKIEMLEEVPRVSSPDIRLNGLLADLKRTKSHNNLVHYAKKAIYKQGAGIVLFQFDVMTPGIRDELNKLKSLGIRCKYFITGESKVYDL